MNKNEILIETVVNYIKNSKFNVNNRLIVHLDEYNMDIILETKTNVLYMGFEELTKPSAISTFYLNNASSFHLLSLSDPELTAKIDEIIIKLFNLTDNSE